MLLALPIGTRGVRAQSWWKTAPTIFGRPEAPRTCLAWGFPACT